MKLSILSVTFFLGMTADAGMLRNMQPAAADHVELVEEAGNEVRWYNHHHDVGDNPGRHI